MIVRVAVVPHPPLLVPELVTGAAGRTEPVRAACVAAATALAQVSDEWLAIAADPAGPATIGPEAAGTFLGYGVDVPVALSAKDSAEPDPGLPLPALVAGWLRDRAGADRVTVRLFAPDQPAEDYRRCGAELADDSPVRVGLLVLGDGSNRHGDLAPARRDDRSGPFDTAVRNALASADHHALGELDPALAAELGVTGWPAWQVLAGTAETIAARRAGTWRAELRYSGTPFGVGYHVAVWDPPPGP